MEVEEILRSAGLHLVAKLIFRQQATLVQWVFLCILMEVCMQDTGYEGGGRNIWPY